MSGADEAFDRLLERNALGIPVVRPRAGDGEGRPGGGEPVREPAGMRLADIPGVLPKDYHPEGHNGDMDNMFATPTETDLEPVDEETNAETARRDSRRLAEAGDAPGRPDAEVGLRRARRFRRFAYLPLSGMENFENRARDALASLASRDPGRPSLAITSPSRGDGRTEMAIRLALAMAKRVDYRVLLADFDTRKPRVATRLGLSSKHFTLSDVLRGSCLLGEALVMSEEDNLYVLPARVPDRDGDEVPDDREVRTLLELIHATFDFAILACGTADSADAGIVCRHAGAAALVGYCGRTGVSALRRAADRLIRNGANVAGMLLTGA